jgi:hypothetical protein
MHNDTLMILHTIQPSLVENFLVNLLTCLNDFANKIGCDVLELNPNISYVEDWGENYKNFEIFILKNVEMEMLADHTDIWVKPTEYIDEFKPFFTKFHPIIRSDLIAMQDFHNINKFDPVNLGYFFHIILKNVYGDNVYREYLNMTNVYEDYENKHLNDFINLDVLKVVLPRFSDRFNLMCAEKGKIAIRIFFLELLLQNFSALLPIINKNLYWHVLIMLFFTTFFICGLGIDDLIWKLYGKPEDWFRTNNNCYTDFLKILSHENHGDGGLTVHVNFDIKPNYRHIYFTRSAANRSSGFLKISAEETHNVTLKPTLYGYNFWLFLIGNIYPSSGGLVDEYGNYVPWDGVEISLLGFRGIGTDLLRSQIIACVEYHLYQFMGDKRFYGTKSQQCKARTCVNYALKKHKLKYGFITKRYLQAAEKVFELVHKDLFKKLPYRIEGELEIPQPIITTKEHLKEKVEISKEVVTESIGKKEVVFNQNLEEWVNSKRLSNKKISYKNVRQPIKMVVDKMKSGVIKKENLKDIKCKRFSNGILIRTPSFIDQFVDETKEKVFKNVVTYVQVEKKVTVRKTIKVPFLKKNYFNAPDNRKMIRTKKYNDLVRKATRMLMCRRNRHRFAYTHTRINRKMGLPYQRREQYKKVLNNPSFKLSDLNFIIDLKKPQIAHKSKKSKKKSGKSMINKTNNEDRPLMLLLRTLSFTASLIYHDINSKILWDCYNKVLILELFPREGKRGSGRYLRLM